MTVPGLALGSCRRAVIPPSARIRSPRFGCSARTSNAIRRGATSSAQCAFRPTRLSPGAVNELPASSCGFVAASRELSITRQARLQSSGRRARCRSGRRRDFSWRSDACPFWEHVDRTDADDPIDWDVIVRPLQGWGKPVEGFGRAFAAALESDGRVALVDWRELPGGGFSEDERAGQQGIVGFVGEGNSAVEGLIRLSAWTLQEAERVANGVCREATAAVLEARGQTPDADPMPWSSEAHAYPTGSRAAAMNARLGGASGELL
jgi:hypothetical protein